MRNPRSTVVVASALVASVAFGAPLVSGAASRPAAPQAAVAAHLVAGAQFHPLAARNTTISLEFSVPPRSPAALKSFIASVSTPGSPRYGKYLAKGQFASRFGASPATVASITHYLGTHGLSGVSVTSDRLFVRAHGSVRAVEALLHTTISFYRYQGKTVYTNTKPARLPAALSGKVATVVGLSDVPEFHASDVLPRTAVHHDATTCSQMTTGTNATSGPFTISQVGDAYGYNAFATHGDLGQGQTLAVFELVNYLPGDIQYYQSCVGKQDTISGIKIDGGGGININAEVEADLDIEVAATLAPKATLEVYQGPNSQAGDIDTYQRIATDDTAQVVTTSWGFCDAADLSADVAESAVFSEMATQGQTVVAAAGDSGASDCLGLDATTANPLAGAIGTDDPASQQYVTGVGGTTITDAATIGTNPTSEVVWDTSDVEGTGGAVSSVVPEPSYQVGVPGTSTHGRTVPDLSIDADPASGYMIYTLGFGWTPIGGTSAGAPMIATLVLLANEYNGVHLGFINPLLYTDGVAHPGQNFNDVTVGNNETYDVPGFSSAATGFDAATGWGSPIGASFLGGDI